MHLHIGFQESYLGGVSCTIVPFFRPLTPIAGLATSLDLSIFLPQLLFSVPLFLVVLASQQPQSLISSSLILVVLPIVSFETQTSSSRIQCHNPTALQSV